MHESFKANVNSLDPLPTGAEHPSFIGLFVDMKCLLTFPERISRGIIPNPYK